MQPSTTEISNKTSSATGLGGQSGVIPIITAVFNKPKRRWLRLDCGHVRDVFRTTFYRIWMYRKRHLLTTLMQLLIPAMILIGMTAYLGTVLKLDTKEWSRYDPLNETQLQQRICGKYCDKGKKGVIALYWKHNSTQFSDQFSKQLKDKFSQFDIELKNVDEKEDLIKIAIRHNLKGEDTKYIAGIEIDNPSEDEPNGTFGIGSNFNLQFTVVMAQKTPGFVFEPTPVSFNLKRNDPNHYYQLLGIEMAVCRTFHQLVEAEHKIENPVSIEVQPLSYPPHVTYALKEQDDDDPVENKIEDNGIDSMLAPIFILSMVPCFFTIIEGPVSEKENGFKFYLQLMGFPRGAYWFHWILNQMMVQLVVIALQVSLIFTEIDSSTGPIVRYGDPSLWAFILVLFNLSSLSFIVFIGSFGRRGKSSTYIGILIWLLSYHTLQSHVFDFASSLTVFLITCLIPSGCIHWAVYIFTTANSISWELSGSFSLTQKSQFTLAHVIIMMIVNFFIYLLLTLYVDNLNPGPLALRQPWNYFFESIRCRFIDPNKGIFGGASGSIKSGTDISRRKNKGNRDHHRCSITNTHAIEFKKISKRFYLIKGMYGIENVQFTVYPGQITVLLGHKDSGKTTLMRLLCGAYAPTSGTVIVFDYDMRKDAQMVQSFLNLCLQSDLLCDYLTVIEHLRLIAKLKGVSGKDADEELKNILESVGLLSQKDDMMWKLAKWQRRVLCVAMALVGDAPVLVLDEPTEGLDNNAKRQIWALLKELKAEGRVILIASHDIGDTYQIADRIVVMSRGRLTGVGTPSKLESIFETGYHLNLKIIPNAKTGEILAFLKQHIKTVRQREGVLSRVERAILVENWDQQQSQSQMKTLSREKSSQTIVNIPMNKSTSNTTMMTNAPNTITKFAHSDDASNVASLHFGLEVSYLLPSRESANFPSLFRALNDVSTAMTLGIKEYDLKWHSIENAFDEIDDHVDVLDATRSKDDVTFDSMLDSETRIVRVLTEKPIDEHMPSFEFNNDRKCCSCWKGLWAIVVKRMCYIIGNYRQCIYQFMAPLVLLIITISSTNVHFTRDLLSPAVYYNVPIDLTAPKVPFRIVSNSTETEKLFESFQLVAKRHSNNLKMFINISTSHFEDYYNKDNWHKLHDEVVIAADFTNVDKPQNRKVTALFSLGHQHSGPLSLLVMFNSILNYEFPERHYRISMTGKAMLHSRQHSILLNSTISKSIIASGVDVTLTVSLAFGCFIFAAGFVMQPCAERISKLKRYQMYSLNWFGLYWIANSLVDLMMNNVLIILLTLVIYYVPSHEVFRDPEFIILFIITGSLGGFSSIIASYYMSHYLLNKSTSYYATISINQVLGLFLFLLYSIINFDYFASFVAETVTFCLEIVQPFTVPWNYHVSILWALQNARCRALNQMVLDELCDVAYSSADYSADIKDARDECCTEDSKKWNLDFIKYGAIVTPLWSNILFLIHHCVGGIIFLMLMESRRRRRKLLYLLHKPEKPPALIEPKDVKSIKNEEMYIQEDILHLDKHIRDKLFIVENLSTSTGNRTLLHPMSFVVEPGKCTVVVGPKTSGITILYEIISGIRAISEGSVSYGGFSLFSFKTRRSLLRQLGLSPSQDAILNKLTGKQLLQLFARLRGIPEKELDTHIDYWVRRLGLSKKIKKQCQSYSPVIRKKLGIACAVIGNPSVFIFDDPTKDLDPVSKSEVCRVISSLIYENRVVLILTHDLASVQHLCSKLIILVNGQMQFCEKTEDIYEETADDFTLTIKLKGDERGKVNFKAFTDFVADIEEAIESMTLQEEQSRVLKYRITNCKHSWAALFETVENIVAKHESVVLNYNIQKTDLADVYHFYAAKQRVFRHTESAWDEFRTTYC